MTLRHDLRLILAAALEACDSATLLDRALAAFPVSSSERFNVVAAGKAAQPMLDAFMARHASQVGEVALARGGHPLPDEKSFAAGARALELADANRARGETFVVLLSGGASAMLASPADGVALEDKIAVTRQLLRSGMPIAEMNAVRKHLSAVKGGQLGARAGRSVTFAISDVHGPIEDDPAVIGSGPTVADPSTFADAVSGLRGAALWDALSGAISRRLQRGTRGEIAETPKPGDARLADARFVLAGSRRDAMAGARVAGERQGYAVEVIEEPVVGEARDAATAFAAHAQARARHATRPLCIVASGETTVALPANGRHGRGGRNQEFALAAAMRLGDLEGYALASFGTDGVDGPTDAAGAIVDATTVARAHEMGLDARAALQAHDAYPFFQTLHDLVVTGPTGTNVGDLFLFVCKPLPKVAGT